MSGPPMRTRPLTFWAPPAPPHFIHRQVCPSRTRFFSVSPASWRAGRLAGSRTHTPGGHAGWLAHLPTLLAGRLAGWLTHPLHPRPRPRSGDCGSSRPTRAASSSPLSAADAALLPTDLLRRGPATPEASRLGRGRLAVTPPHDVAPWPVVPRRLPRSWNPHHLLLIPAPRRGPLPRKHHSLRRPPPRTPRTTKW
jgi:hypothetical protein